ncbi:MAG: pyridoxal-phosphate dependent enzyme [Pseudomonadota bacterium]
MPRERLTLPGGAQLTVHRLDRCYPHHVGNKGPKLQARLAGLVASGVEAIVSVGGAYSNHLHALAATGHRLGLRTVGIVCGVHADLDNPTLRDAARWGMVIRRVDRATYARRASPVFVRWLARAYPAHTLIPEGGNDPAGVAACRALAPRLQLTDCRALVVPMGTGATVTGLRQGLSSARALVAANVVGAAGERSVASSIAGPLETVDAARAGYGRVDAPLLDFLARSYAQTGVLFDPLYSGKAAFWCAKAGCPQLHLLHTGGLQGWRGFAERGALARHPALAAAVANLRF